MTETSATYTTNHCNCDDGHIFFERDGINYAAECECLKRKREATRLFSLFRSAKVPERYLDKSLENFIRVRQPGAHRVAETYLHNWETIKLSGQGLVFVGGVGTGKTHLSFAVFNKLIELGVSGLAVTVPDLMDELRPRAEEKQSKQVEVLKTIDLLLLDDLGAQRNTEWVTERLFIIINARYNNLKPTIITSNNSLEELDKLDGWKRIVDRIGEMCQAVKMVRGSFRSEAGQHAETK